MEELRRTELIARVEERVLRGLEQGDAPRPAALLFLLRRYLVADSGPVAECLEHGLGVALAQHGDSVQTIDRADWLMLFVEAAHASADERIPATVSALADALSSEWATDDDVERTAASIDACLRASERATAPMLVQRAIDELERIVAIAYQPGGVSGGVPQTVRLASALLTAFAITARLPYAMLAEELVKTMQRNNWDRPSGLFAATISVNCEAVRVLNRLGELHRNAEYRGAAVLAPGADYESDAAAILEALAPHMASYGFPSAPYGLALIEHAHDAPPHT
ncbi:MAG TPA: hypothetical protein VGJ29_18730 [Vicinamibacterales bacterium]